MVAPFVDALLEARARARMDGRWNDADALRNVLIANGIEVHDDVERTEWALREFSNK
jgi:cysteinyl-tRNA synthetase